MSTFSRSTLFLAGKPNVLELLQHGLPVVHEKNRVFWHGRIRLNKLVGLTWRCPFVMAANGNSYECARLAAEKLCVRNPQALVEEYKVRSGRRSGPYAEPGDFIIVLPSTGSIGGDLPYNDIEAIRQRLHATPVGIVYIGEELPADISTVYKEAHWEKHTVVVDDPVYYQMIENSTQEITIFDALRAKCCVDGLEQFQKEFFPDRAKVTVGELLPHRCNGYVRHVVTAVLGPAPKNEFDYPVPRSSQAVARVLGLHAFP